MISIIIPLFNQAEKLKNCLESIKNQTYQNFEIIIVNDGSKDNPEETIKDYIYYFGIKLTFINQENKGSNPTRNVGWRLAKGEYLLFCDADITMQPTMLEEMLNALRNNPDKSYAYSSHKFGNKVFKFWPFDAEKLKQMPYLHSTTLIKASDFPKGGWDENIKRLQDWDVFLTMLENGKTGIWIDKILFKMETGGTISSWLPSFAYNYLTFLPKVKKYNSSVRIIKEKHHLN